MITPWIVRRSLPDAAVRGGEHEVQWNANGDITTWVTDYNFDCQGTPSF